MSLHISAKPGEIAETVLISGDPLRARNIAETMLTEVICYNQVRGMLGFTGFYKGKRVSVQGTGMGIPSTAIYVHEFMHSYNVKKIIRVGTCGAIQPELELGQLIIAEAAYTDSATHQLYFPDPASAAPAPGRLLEQAITLAQQLQIPIISGPVFTSDLFYSEAADRWDNWIKKGVLAVEMETSILYALAAYNQIEALSILSVSDNIITEKLTTAQEREHASSEMMRLALELA
ncbi:purine-nucleoside phosphorylase [Adhaeribacter sp. BT258]|uniref:Uridine phosphorylase n=1 Tax=Adhaeribacter terrigena TaxID=2793070 RepID=A0ABS1C2J8_9BACT|nr:purine-nucleoside phosphorylase [Adhaeribacter terrigena]MBK0403371.1 purine-nucleoside phosphorylase [Adhaeribacter terrigena]